MGIQEDIKKMKSEGKSDREIIDNLRSQGIKDNVISEALAQSKIKEAVTASEPAEDLSDQPKEEESFSQQDKAMYSAPSTSQKISVNENLPYDEKDAQYTDENLAEDYAPQPENYGLEPGGEYANQEYAEVAGGLQSGYSPGNYQADNQYQPYIESFSSDMITEITEQIVEEKMSIVQEKLEKAINFRTIADAKIESLNERLKRIEKIIDKLQLSLLEKVGEYVNDVRDLKHELQETQKSFAALAKKKQTAHATSGQSKHHHHP